MPAPRQTCGEQPQTIDPQATITDAAGKEKHRRRRGGKRRNRARKTVAQIHETSSQRQNAWRRGDRADLVERTTGELFELYGRLGVERARGETTRHESEGSACLPGNRVGGGAR
jgi:Ni/Co efflux regulator RcnB